MDNSVAIHNHLQGIRSHDWCWFRSSCLLFCRRESQAEIQWHNLIVRATILRTGSDPRVHPTFGVGRRNSDWHCSTLRGNRSVRYCIGFFRHRHTPTCYEIRSTCFEKFKTSYNKLLGHWINSNKQIPVSVCVPVVRSSYSGVSEGDIFSAVFGTKIDELSFRDAISSNSDCNALDKSLVSTFSDPCRAERLSANMASLNSAFWRILQSFLILSSTSTRSDSSRQTREEVIGFWTSRIKMLELRRSSVSACERSWTAVPLTLNKRKKFIFHRNG